MEILDGKKLSKKVEENLKEEISRIKDEIGKIPGLAVIQVGNHPASEIYVASKIKKCESIGIHSESVILSEDISEENLIKEIKKLNADETIHGILVQLPLPKHLNTLKIIDAIDIYKDVDGFKAENLGKILLGDETAQVPCTPAGIIRLLEEHNVDVSGKDITVLGRSNIVGKPIAGILINKGATVTVCNTKTKNLVEKTKEADIIIVAIGKEKFLNSDMIKDGAILVDVGINRDSNNKVCGDIDFESVKEKAAYITPVPGGVGPMTIAMLLENTFKSFKLKNKIK